MCRSTIATVALFLLVGVLSSQAQSQTLSSNSTGADHITMQGPTCPPFPCADFPLQEQIRFLIGHWPHDFEIAVVEAVEKPKCHGAAGRANCRLRVQPVELILGHREPAGDRAGRMETKWNDAYEMSYSLAEQSNPKTGAGFDVKRGDRLVALLTPAIHQPNKPVSYIATRLDHVGDATVESVRNAVADSLYQALGPSTGKQTE